MLTYYVYIYIYIYTHIHIVYIYIYVCIAELPEVVVGGVAAVFLQLLGCGQMGAAAEVMNFDSVGKKVRPGTFGKIKVG